MIVPTAPTSPLTVDIVDDDADLRRALRRLLSANGFTVRVHDSAEAYLASRNEPDCLVLDVQLGGISGLQLYSRLRERASVPPVVFITAHQDVAGDLAAVRAHVPSEALRRARARQRHQRRLSHAPLKVASVGQ